MAYKFRRPGPVTLLAWFILIGLGLLALLAWTNIFGNVMDTVDFIFHTKSSDLH